MRVDAHDEIIHGAGLCATRRNMKQHEKREMGCTRVDEVEVDLYVVCFVEGSMQRARRPFNGAFSVPITWGSDVVISIQTCCIVYHSFTV